MDSRFAYPGAQWQPQASDKVHIPSLAPFGSVRAPAPCNTPDGKAAAEVHRARLHDKIFAHIPGAGILNSDDNLTIGFDQASNGGFNFNKLRIEDKQHSISVDISSPNPVIAELYSHFKSAYIGRSAYATISAPAPRNVSSNGLVPGNAYGAEMHQEIFKKFPEARLLNPNADLTINFGSTFNEAVIGDGPRQIAVNLWKQAENGSKRLPVVESLNRELTNRFPNTNLFGTNIEAGSTFPSIHDFALHVVEHAAGGGQMELSHQSNDKRTLRSGCDVGTAKKLLEQHGFYQGVHYECDRAQEIDGVNVSHNAHASWDQWNPGAHNSSGVRATFRKAWRAVKRAVGLGR